MSAPEDIAVEAPEAQRSAGAATTRSTAGPGFDFENRVGAWFLSKALCGEPIVGVGALSMLQFQTRALGWLIDDILLIGAEDPVRRLAVSCKANVQVSAAGWPADFIEAAWALWQDRAGPMTPDLDSLALVTRGRDLKFDPVWTEIAADCAGADPALAIARIRQTPARARIFDSVRREAQDPSRSDEAAVGLARRLQTLPLDLQLAASVDLAASIARCRTLLTSNAQAEAEDLWDTLVQLVHSARVGSGTLTVASVWAALRGRYALKDMPDYDAAWRGLTAASSDHVAGIDLALPSGLRLPRTRQVKALGDLIAAQPVSVVFGESGAGKSALVKSTLDARFPAARQLWLGPDDLGQALGAATRLALGLTRPLGETLAASAAADNVLVLDSAERIPPDRLALARQLIDALAPAAEVAPAGWRMVLVTQAEGWSARAPAILGQRVIRPFDVEAFTPEEVRDALWSSSDMSWLADTPNALTALANPKLLAWVMQAPATTPTPEQLASPAAVVDHIWAYWTGGDLAAQGLLTRLARREAEFERLFPISELDPADAQTVQRERGRIPLRTTNNLLEFTHDLASDLARFQRLREIGHDLSAWAPLAVNPLWHAALRLFGQLLLREPAGTHTRWDGCLAQAEAEGQASAVDLLLDALCLDPSAEAFLTERTGVLFANDGRLLNRLLGRFLHVATVPGAFGVLSGSASITNLYLQAVLRTPIVGRWPAVARFLHANLDAVARLMSPTVASVCQLWLTRLPVQLTPGVSTPFRREFAEIALASSRAMQVQKGGGVMFMGDNVKAIDAATLAGAEDLPEEVAAWALEMAGRRPVAADIRARITAEVARRRADQAARDAANPRPKRAPAPVSIPMSRRLAPWPLGASRRIDRDFRDAAYEARALAPLMRSRPDAAAEALLALMIDDEPREDYGSSSRYDEDLGLEYSREAYPTAFWKSPFYVFLQIDPERALTALIQLIDFCTERWRADWERHASSPAPAVVLTLADGSARAFYGGWKVFDWAEASSPANGHIHCALSALERWLVDTLEAGGDCTSVVERLLRETTSASVLGVLVSIAKLRPRLLTGVLMPLLSTADLFELDGNRVEGGTRGAYLTTWSHEGELVFEAAKQWTFAPHRRRQFADVVGLALVESPGAAAVAAATAAALPPQDHPAAKLRRDALCARLDPTNYPATPDPETGELTYAFDPPDALVEAYAAQQVASGPKLQSVLLASALESVLKGEKSVDVSDLPLLADFLKPPSEANADLDQAAVNAVAVAATLASIARDWLAENPDIAATVKDFLRRGALAVADDAAGVRHERVGLASTQLKFVAHGVMRLWLREGLDSEWEPLVLRLLTSGNAQVVAVIGWIAYHERERLGPVWWRLQQLGCLWSALSMLAPHYDSQEGRGPRWARWLARFRALKISGVAAGLDSLDLVKLAERLERLERDEQRRQVASGSRFVHRERKAHRLAGLQTDLFQGLFGWLVADGALPVGPDLDVARALLFKFFDYEAQWCADHADDNGEYHLPYSFGFQVVDRLAGLTAQDRDRGAEAWRAVLGLGPAAHSLIDHFLTAWSFETPASDVFAQRWREMIEFGLAQEWGEGAFWYDGEKLLRQLMGFNAISLLARRDDATAVVGGMADLYARWATRHLAVDERNIAAFANFLEAPFSQPLRMMGLARLVDMLDTPLGKRAWTRDSAGETVVALLDRMLAADLAAVRADPVARACILRLAAALAERKVPAALSLQERAAQLLR